MDTTDIELFKSLLTLQLETLMQEAGRTVDGFKEEENQYADPGDQATFEEQRNMLIRIRDRESYLIRKIMSALDRLEDGTFGICDTCEEEIAMERLKARPVTTKCITCKSIEEAHERGKAGNSLSSYDTMRYLKRPL